MTMNRYSYQLRTNPYTAVYMQGSDERVKGFLESTTSVRWILRRDCDNKLDRSRALLNLQNNEISQ